MASRITFTDEDDIMECTIIGESTIDITIYQKGNVRLAKNIILDKKDLSRLIADLKVMEARLNR